MALFGRKSRAERSPKSPFKRRRVIKSGSSPFANHMAGHFSAKSGDWAKAINIGLDMWEAAGTMQPEQADGPIMLAEPDLVIWEGLDAWKRSGAWDPRAAYELTRSIFNGLASAGDDKMAVFAPRGLKFLRESGADEAEIREAEEAFYPPMRQLPFNELPYAAQDFVDLMRSRNEE